MHLNPNNCSPSSSSFSDRNLHRAFNKSSRRCLDGKVKREDTQRGGGAHADIWRGKITGRPGLVAIKILREFTGIDKEKLRHRLWREHFTWRSLTHPNIHKCLGYTYDFSHDSSHPIPALISPWMSNGTLREYVVKNKNADQIALMVGVCEGLNYLHSQSNPVVHGDLNGGNILVSLDGAPCLTDFGLSRVMEEVGFTTTTPTGGTTRWMAPELFKNEDTTVSSDVWAFGMTLLEIVSGKFPYYNIAVNAIVISEITAKTIPERPSLSLSPTLTDPVWKLCTRCWSPRPKDRPRISTVLEALKSCIQEGFEESFGMANSYLAKKIPASQDSLEEELHDDASVVSSLEEQLLVASTESLIFPLRQETMTQWQFDNEAWVTISN